MSREIIDHIKVIAVAANELYIDACDGKSIDVGRDERDRICDALKEIERLLAQEREKVREMCLSVIETFLEQLGRFSVLPARRLLIDIRNLIHQLDLTTPSSTEEGKR